MINSIIMADLERALELLAQVDENKLEFAPDPNVSPDIRDLTGVKIYPNQTHLINIKARIAAVASAGDKLKSRHASSYVSKLIIACASLAPPSD
jgi:hypothetical protein